MLPGIFLRDKDIMELKLLFVWILHENLPGNEMLRVLAVMGPANLLYPDTAWIRQGHAHYGYEMDMDFILSIGYDATIYFAYFEVSRHHSLKTHNLGNLHLPTL